MDLKFMFYLPYPGHLNQKENAFSEKEIEISFTKFVKAKDTRLKYLINAQQAATNTEFSFYHQNLVTERQITLSVNCNYFKNNITKELDEKKILSFVESGLSPDSHTAKLIQNEIKKMVQYEILRCPNSEYLNNWIKKILFYINKSIEKMHHELRA